MFNVHLLNTYLTSGSTIRDDFLGIVVLDLSDLPTEEGDSTTVQASNHFLKPKSSKSKVKGYLKVYAAYLRFVIITVLNVQIRHSTKSHTIYVASYRAAQNNAVAPSTPDSIVTPRVWNRNIKLMRSL